MPAPTNKTAGSDQDSHPDDPKATNFILNSDDSQFRNRTSSIFESLGSLEDNHVQHVRHSDFNEERSLWKSDPESEEKVAGSRSNTRPFGTAGGPPFSGRQQPGSNGQGFKRPHPSSGHRGSGGRGRANVPGFRTEPGKWRRYDLSSVSSNDMSDKTNAKAAFEFLNELKDRKECDSESMDVDESDDSDSHHIVFKRPEKKNIPAASGCSTSVAESSSKSGSSQSLPMPPGQGKILMPEYVVGEKVHKKNPKASWAASSSSAAEAEHVQLGHIKDVEAGTKELPKEDSSESSDGIVFKTKSAKGKGKKNVRKRHVEDEDD